MSLGRTPCALQGPLKHHRLFVTPEILLLPRDHADSCLGGISKAAVLYAFWISAWEALGVINNKS